MMLIVSPSMLRISKRRENGQRNGNGHHQRAAPTAKEEQNQRRRQARGDDRFAQNAVHRVARTKMD
jgi:hypothetical protein